MIQVLLERAEFEEAYELANDSLQTRWCQYEKEPEHLDIYYGLYWKGQAAFEMGRLDDAEECYKEALDMIRQSSEEDAGFDLARITYRVAMIHLAKGDIPEAEALCKESTTASQRNATSVINIGNAYQGLAKIAMAKGELKEAENYCSENMRLTRKFYSDGVFNAISMHVKGMVKLRYGQIKKSMYWMMRSLKIL